jgi:hypothetical protein
LTELPVPTVLERGPKGKKVVAFAIDWPGWSRGAKTPADALATLDSYRQRYRPIALAAGRVDEFDGAGPLEVIEEQVGTGSTDFWGISFSSSATEADPMSDTELQRKIKLLQASWAFFDGVAARVSPGMRKGPRGGGRDRDEQEPRSTLRRSNAKEARPYMLRFSNLSLVIWPSVWPLLYGKDTAAMMAG